MRCQFIYPRIRKGEKGEARWDALWQMGYRCIENVLKDLVRRTLCIELMACWKTPIGESRNDLNLPRTAPIGPSSGNLVAKLYKHRCKTIP